MRPLPSLLQDAFWAKYYAADDVVMIRPSGNPMGKELYAQMINSDDIVSESEELLSIDEPRIFCGGNAAVITYTKHSRFVYKGQANDDIAKFSATLEKGPHGWKVVFGQRATGQKPSA